MYNAFDLSRELMEHVQLSTEILKTRNLILKQTEKNLAEHYSKFGHYFAVGPHGEVMTDNYGFPIPIPIPAPDKAPKQLLDLLAILDKLTSGCIGKSLNQEAGVQKQVGYADFKHLLQPSPKKT